MRRVLELRNEQQPQQDLVSPHKRVLASSCVFKARFCDLERSMKLFAAMIPRPCDSILKLVADL
jgi:hypothetical protein